MDKVDQALNELKEELDNSPIIQEYLRLKEVLENDEELKAMRQEIARLTNDLKTVFSKANKRFVKRLKFKERFSLKLQYRTPSLYNLLKKKKS